MKRTHDPVPATARRPAFHLAAATLLLAGVTAGNASAETLWTTNPSLPTTVGEYLVGPSIVTPATVREVADDFNVVGSVERILADGEDCNNGCFGGQPVSGVYVRFYEWTASGPGAMQSEQFLADGDPGFAWDHCCGPEFLQITLPQPFAASGWHFVSVQVAIDGTGSADQWHFHRTNVGAPQGQAAWIRDGTGAWSEFHVGAGWPAIDVSFRLEGVAGGTPMPQIVEVIGTPATPSGRLRIRGSGFLPLLDGGEIRIGGNRAIVTQWADDSIVAYVPESTPPGPHDLQLVDDGIVIDSFPISVEPRLADGRVHWRFAVDADRMAHRPGLASDGSVYANDNAGRLYKLSADGALLWVVDALRGQNGIGAEGPVVVGGDGAVYTVVNPLGPTSDLVAFGPDGQLRWVYTDPGAMATAVGPAVGPDGNVYVAFHNANGNSQGLVSLTPDGGLRWNNAGDPFLYEHAPIGAELAFGASTPGGPVDQVVLTVDRDVQGYLYAFDMVSGQQRWAVPRGPVESLFLQFQTQAGTGPDGTVYMTEFTGLGGLGWGLKAFDPSTGALHWRFDPGIASEVSAPATGSDGTVYFSWDISRVSAVTPGGDEVWTHTDTDGLIRTGPSVGPGNDIVLVGGGNLGVPGRFIALDAATGSELWRVDLPQETGAVVPDARAIFSADGDTAYFPTTILSDPPPYQYSYLYSLALGNDPADSDGDGIADDADNCTLAANAAQHDTDDDGIGNRCDADFNNDCVVNFADAAAMKSVFLSADPDADLNGDGVVNFGDLALLKAAFLGAPGPSGLATACATD